MLNKLDSKNYRGPSAPLSSRGTFQRFWLDNVDIYASTYRSWSNISCLSSTDCTWCCRYNNRRMFGCARQWSPSNRVMYSPRRACERRRHLEVSGARHSTKFGNWNRTLALFQRTGGRIQELKAFKMAWCQRMVTVLDNLLRFCLGKRLLKIV